MQNIRSKFFSILITIPIQPHVFRSSLRHELHTIHLLIISNLRNVTIWLPEGEIINQSPFRLCFAFSNRQQYNINDQHLHFIHISTILQCSPNQPRHRFIISKVKRKPINTITNKQSIELYLYTNYKEMAQSNVIKLTNWLMGILVTLPYFHSSVFLDLMCACYRNCELREMNSLRYFICW